MLYHKKRSISGAGKAESEWYDGVFLGIAGSYVMIGTAHGIDRATGFRRQVEDQQWNRKLIELRRCSDQLFTC